MEESKKTNEQLTSELTKARQQIKHLDARLAQYQRDEEYAKQWRDIFTLVFTSLSIPLCLVNVDNSKFMLVNDAFVQFVGYTREEIIGHTFQELNLFVNSDDMKNMETRLQSTGLLANTEIKSRMKSGEIRTGLFSAETFDLEDTHYLLFLITDITDVKKMEASLRDSESKLAVAFRSSPHALVIVTMGEGTFIEINDNVCRLTGYSREEIIGHTIEELKIWDDQNFRTRMAKALWEKGRITNEELVWRTRNGEKINMMLSGEIADIGGKKCIVASIADITYLKKVEQELRKSEERFSKAFNATPGVLSISKVADGTFLEINDSFTRVFGYTRQETIGHKSLDMNLWVNSDDRINMVRQLMETGIVRNKEYLHRTKSGDIRTLLFSATSIEFDGETCVLATTVDITDYKRIEAEAREAGNFRELDRLRTELLANVSHELRTPLAGIKGFATMLLDYDKKLSVKEKREYLETIDKNTDRMVELIEQLLEMSRLGTGMLSIKKVPTDVISLCQVVVSEARVRAPEYVFALDMPPKLPEMIIDDKRIHQVLDNIINNAVKYSSAGTEIKISVRVVDKDMLFSVTDHGVGIPEKDLPNLFQRMFHPAHLQKMGTGGAGLGLSISKGLIEAHGGKIWIESKEGAGTKCYFTLPINGKSEGNGAEKQK
jgi:PAS domain S-box-containing protein